MDEVTSPLVGHRLSASERRDGRFALALLGAALLLLAYLLPMFTQRITAATTTFSGKTVLQNEFPILVSGQHAAQATHPLNEELKEVAITVQPVSQHGASGYAWLVYILAHAPRFISFWLCLLVPLLSALLAVAFVALCWTRPRGLPEGLIAPLINMAILGVLAVVLAWLHQIDFSTYLQRLAPRALAPRIGFWIALLGAVAILGAALALHRETPNRIFSWWALVWVVALCIWLLIRFRPYPYLEIWLFVQDGIIVTLQMVLTSFGFILLVSLLGGLGRISKVGPIYGLASLYVEIIRGIPLLVQLLFIWFALPQVFDVLGQFLISLSPGLAGFGQKLVDLRLSPFTAAVAGFTICYGAYGSEIFRAGISSINRGQMEAARSLGMNYVQAMRHIVLPQAIRVILPPLGNEFVALLKDSSLVSVLAVSDLTRRGREYMARTFLSFDTWIMVALCYLVLTLFSSRIVEFIESRSKFER
jgi:polar amino acid transport system permease protein